MPFSSDHGGVSVFVMGEFVAPREWLIRATVQRRSVAHAATRQATCRRALRELWQGIALESRDGRRLGAHAVRVVVDGDPDIAGLFVAPEGRKEATPPISVRLPGADETTVISGSSVAAGGVAQGAASGAA